MNKSVISIFFEALIVGILLILVYNPIYYLLKDYNNNFILFLSGFLFHILCEYSGVNIWYVNDYKRILDIVK
jgi:preprotein translocase subunit SecD